MDPDVRVLDPPVDRDLPLNLVFRIVFCNPQIRLTELAVPAAAPHDLDKTMSGWCENVRNLLKLRTPRNMNELRRFAGLYVVVNVLDNMVALANYHVIHAQRLRVSVADLHLPSAGPAEDQLGLWILLPCLVNLLDEFEKLPFRVCGKLSPVREHHAHRPQAEWVHRGDSDDAGLLVYKF